MVWQRSGNRLESPGQKCVCVDAGGGKTTEVKRCLVSPNQYRCYGQNLQAKLLSFFLFFGNTFQ